MCGILAHFSKCQKIDPLAFSRQLACQAHRGPDGQAQWVSEDQSVALGHNLLSLTGVSNVSQPLQSEDGRIIASVNGEFYGYEEIRSDLEGRGHCFHSDSDSEIVIHLYEEYGDDCVDHLRGEFAFVLWDQKQQRLFAARDRFGVKPLHYQDGELGLTLSSEAKAILHESQNRRWNRRALKRVFTHQYLAPTETLFEGIHQVPPAHGLIFHDGVVTVRRYWQPMEEEQTALCPEELLGSLERSVADRIHSKAAYSLSGGIDSSAIVALASRCLGQPVPAFSVSFDEDRYDEFSLLRDGKSELEANVERVPVTRKDLLEVLPTAVEMSEGLAINGQLVGKYLLAKAIKTAGYRAVLSGEGADEAFLGYAHIVADQNPATKLNHPLQCGLMLPSGSEGIPLPPPKGMKLWPSFMEAKYGFCSRFRPLLSTDFREDLSSVEIFNETLERLYECQFDLSERDQAHQSGWMWTRLALSNAILKTLGDGTEMPHGIEGRVPFLDHDFFEKAWRIPVDKKIAGDQSKVIFREATQGLLPEKISQRPKHPFLAPPLLGDSHVISEVRDILSSSDFSQLTFFDQAAVLEWFEGVVSGSAQQQQEADPILQTILSCLFLQNAYQLTL